MEHKGGNPNPKRAAVLFNQEKLPHNRYLRKKEYPLVNPLTLKSLKSEVLSLFQEVSTRGKKPFIFFDLDGTLIEDGIETPVNKKTLNMWIIEQQHSITIFKKEIEKLRKFGFEICISTGRGLDFSKRIVDAIFPQQSVSTIIAEGGAIIARSQKNYEGEPAQNIHKKDLEVLYKYREEIRLWASGIGATEEQKEIRLTLNPKTNQSAEEFEEQVKNHIALLSEKNPHDKDSLNSLSITRSKTSVDILPQGVDKITALQEVLKDNVSIYFGDAPNDIPAMEFSQVTAIPQNADIKVQNAVKKINIGLSSQLARIQGVIDELKLIEIYYRHYRKKFK